MGSKQIIKSYKQDIRRNARMLRGARMSGFTRSTDVLGSLYGSLGSTVSGTGASMTQEQGRQLSALSRLRDNQARGAATTTRRARTDVQSLYGSAIAGGNVENLRSVRVAGKAGTKAVGAAAAAGGILARGNEAAQTTLEQGVQLAQAGASAQLADALGYRARNDAALIAQQSLELKKMVLQNELDLENYKAKLALEDNRAGANGQMTAVATTAAGATQGLWDIFNKYYDSDGNPVSGQQVTKQGDGSYAYTKDDGTLVTVYAPTATTAAALYANQYGITDQNQASVIQAIASAMYSAGAGKVPGYYDKDPSYLLNAVNQQMALLYPNYAKHQDAISGLISSSFNIQRGQRAIQGGTDDPAAGGGGSGLDAAGQGLETGGISAGGNGLVAGLVAGGISWLLGQGGGADEDVRAQMTKVAKWLAQQDIPAAAKGDALKKLEAALRAMHS